MIEHDKILVDNIHNEIYTRCSLIKLQPFMWIKKQEGSCPQRNRIVCALSDLFFLGILKRSLTRLSRLREFSCLVGREESTVSRIWYARETVMLFSDVNSRFRISLPHTPLVCESFGP